MVIIGGPRRSAAERKNTELLSAQRFRRSGGSSGSNGGSGNSSSSLHKPSTRGSREEAQGGSGRAPGSSSDGDGDGGGSLQKSNNGISQHLAIMERLRAKVQARPGSSLAAPAAHGKAGRKVNAVLAAGDGHRGSARGSGSGSGGNGARLPSKRLEGDSKGAATGVRLSVSRRARAMGMSATAAKDSAAAAVAVVSSSCVTRREKRGSGGSAKGGDDIGYSDGSGGSGSGANRRGRRILDKASSDGTEARSAKGEHHQRKNGRTGAAAPHHPANGASIEGGDACAMVLGSGSTGPPNNDALPAVGNDKHGAGGATTAGMPTRDSPGLDDRDREGRSPTRRERHPSLLDSERELTPERKATRRVGGTTRSGRVSVTGASSSRSSSFRAGAVGQRAAKQTRSLAGERSSAAGGVYSSAGANGSSTGLPVSGPGAKGATAAAVDEAGLAVAMMNILQSGSEGLFSSSGTIAPTTAAGASGAGEGQQQQQAARRKLTRDSDRTKSVAAATTGPSLLLATQIVNTVGGGHDRGGGSEAGTDFRRPSTSSSASLDALIAPASGARKARPTTAAKGRTGGGTAGNICRPGLVAVGSSSSSGSRRTGNGGGGSGVEGDWRLRASRAVGRVREEEEATKAAAVATAASEESEAASHGGGGSQKRSATLLPNDSNRSQISRDLPSRSRTNTNGAAGLDAADHGRQWPSPTLQGNETTASALLSGRVSDSDEDGGDGSKWSVGGGAGGSGGEGGDTSASRREEGSTRDRKRGPSSCPPSAATTPITEVAARPRPVGGNKKLAKKTTEVSDNFVRADLKSRGSSRFKRKGSGRSKARGGSGGRSFGGRGGAGGGRWGRGGRGFGGGRFGGGGSKWGGGSKGGEDPVTGERGGAPRDRPLSSGAAKNRAGLDVLDQVS